MSRSYTLPLGVCIVVEGQLYLFAHCILIGEPGNSVNIVSGHGLDDRAIEVRFPAEAKGVFL
jgi:hypothetical protein